MLNRGKTRSCRTVRRCPFRTIYSEPGRHRQGNMRALLFAVGAALGIAAFPAFSARLPPPPRSPSSSSITRRSIITSSPPMPNEIADLESGVHAGWTRTGSRSKASRRAPQEPGTDRRSAASTASPKRARFALLHRERPPSARPCRQMFADQWVFESAEVFRAFAVDPEHRQMRRRHRADPPAVEQARRRQPSLHRSGLGLRGNGRQGLRAGRQRRSDADRSCSASR